MPSQTGLLEELTNEPENACDLSSPQPPLLPLRLFFRTVREYLDGCPGVEGWIDGVIDQDYMNL